MESVEEEVFEVQTLQPFHGWAFERFCDRSGNTFPALTHAAQRVSARDDKLNVVLNSQERQQGQQGEHAAAGSYHQHDSSASAVATTTTSRFEIGELPSAEWMWSHEWMPDVEYPQCDEEGWSYGSTIARINRRLAEGTSLGKREYYHFVRRRRWIRTRVKKPPPPDVRCEDSSSSSSSSGGDDDTSSHRTSDLLTPTRYYRVYRDSVFAHFHFRATPRQPNFDRIEFTDDAVPLEGWLGMRGTFSRSWRLRYFLLRLDRSSLVCLRDRASLVQICEEVIDRHTSVTAEESPNPQQFQFLVINRSRQLRLNAVDAATRAAWLSALSELIVRSRASFFAGDESESNVSVRSRTFRRMQHASIDFDDDASQSGYPLTNTVGGSGFFHGVYGVPGAGTGTGTIGGPVVKKKTRRRAWRPYKLVSATMHSRVDTDRLRRFDYFERFRRDIRKLIDATESFVSSNIDVLEENLRAAEQLLSSAVAGVPKQDIAQLRCEVDDSLRAFENRVQCTLEREHANVLNCNALSRELYLLAQRLNELVLSFAPPVAQATVKKVIVESPTKRRIPEDWFTEPKDYERQPSQSTSSISNSVRGASASVRSERAQSSTAATASAARIDNKTSMSKSLLEAKPSGSRRTSNSDQTGTSRYSSTTSSALSVSEPIRIKPYGEMPSVLTEGHFELPPGVNDYVIKVHDKDLGALIGFTLCSKAYMDELENHFGKSIDIAKELAFEERKSFQRVDPNAATAASSGSSIALRLSPRRRDLYLTKMRSNDVKHTDMKFAYDAGTTTHSIRCVTFFAAQFHALRALTEPGNLQFLNSIAESRRWDTSGGKSGAFFSMTHDKRYVLKGISLTEFNMFLHMAPHYFRFMAHVLEQQSATVMTKILGLFKLSHARRLHKQTTYVVVMENLAFGCSPGQMYDIKGILRRRYDRSDSESDDDDIGVDAAARARTGGDGNSFQCSGDAAGHAHAAVKLPVLLDGNLADRIPIPVSQSDLDVLNQAIQNDTGFLCRAGVIDYSMLMLFDEERREVVFGLIDYLHQFDFLKKMESTSKAGLTFRNPTVISPVSYRRRFVNAMHRYLVGIEEELELRMRKRCYPSKGKKLSTSSAALQVFRGQSDGAESGGTISRRQSTPQDALVSAQRDGDSASKPPPNEVSGSGVSGAGCGDDSNAPTSASSFAESVASVEPQEVVTKSADVRLKLIVNASRRHGRSLSHVSLGHDATPYDHAAGKAHSDGEDFSSTSSDDNCLKGSQALIDSMLSEFED